MLTIILLAQLAFSPVLVAQVPAPHALAERSCAAAGIVNADKVSGMLDVKELHALTQEDQRIVREQLSSGNVELAKGTMARYLLGKLFPTKTASGHRLGELFAALDDAPECK